MIEICVFIITAKYQMVIFITFCFIDTVHELLDHPSYIKSNIWQTCQDFINILLKNKTK